MAQEESSYAVHDDDQGVDQYGDSLIHDNIGTGTRFVEPDSFFEIGHRFFIFVGAIVAIFLLVLIIAPASGSAVMNPHPGPENITNRVVLISLDGYAFKFLNASFQNSSLYQAPHLKSIYERGWAAPLRPVFPSKTFPNHYTIVTGLYTESHGIVSNTMWDPVWNQTFNMGNSWSLPQWWGGEPLWVTAVRQEMIAGCMFWPGSDAAIDGVRPTYWHKFEGGLPYPDRVANALGWLALPESPQFVTLYFEAVDSAGHSYGPDNYEKIQEAITHVDDAVGLFLDGLTSLGIRESTNIIIVSDHGMAEVSPSRSINLNDYFDVSTVHFVDMGVFAGIWPLPNESEEQLIARVYPLVHGKNPHMEIYTKQTMPERWHWGNNRRVAPLNIVSENGWWVFTPNNPLTHPGGAHGYDNTELDMQSIIVATGPAFRDDQALLGSIYNIDLYEMITFILGLDPAPNNGSLTRINDADIWAHSDDEDN